MYPTHRDLIEMENLIFIAFIWSSGMTRLLRSSLPITVSVINKNPFQSTDWCEFHWKSACVLFWIRMKLEMNSFKVKIICANKSFRRCYSYRNYSKLKKKKIQLGQRHGSGLERKTLHKNLDFNVDKSMYY